MATATEKKKAVLIEEAKALGIYTPEFEALSLAKMEAQVAEVKAGGDAADAPEEEPAPVKNDPGKPNELIEVRIIVDKAFVEGFLRTKGEEFPTTRKHFNKTNMVITKVLT